MHLYDIKTRQCTEYYFVKRLIQDKYICNFLHCCVTKTKLNT